MKFILIFVSQLILTQVVFCGEELIKEEHAIAIRQALGTLNGLLGSLLGLLTGLLGVSAPVSTNNCLLGLGSTGGSGNSGSLGGGSLGGGGNTGSLLGSLG